MLVRLLSGLGPALVSLALVLTALGGPAAANEPTPPDEPCGGAVPMEHNAPENRPVPEGAYFNFPNGSAADRTAIRDQVLNTINSTNGDYCIQDGFLADGTPRFVGRHGSIKIATWSYNDWEITHALIAAQQRGASVQVIAARNVNELSLYQPWIATDGLRQSLGYHRDPVPANLLDDEHSWAHDCRGACRGPRGTPHSKYFLFDDVRSTTHGEHLRHVVMQGSANLTKMAYEGQWNQADAIYGSQSYADFVENFYEAAQEVHRGYVRYDRGQISNIFFPKSATQQDPWARLLASADCSAGTTVRVVNYAIYDNRGVTLARQLRRLSASGCDVRVIYAIGGRSVLRILRSRGRGRIPVKQSVIRNARRQIVKYNHSKWLSVGDRVLAGSGNWSNSSLNDDEQFREFWGAASFRVGFDKTWNQSSSRTPRGARIGGNNFRDVPAEPQWGKGELKYLTPEG